MWAGPTLPPDRTPPADPRPAAASARIWSAREAAGEAARHRARDRRPPVDRRLPSGDLRTRSRHARGGDLQHPQPHRRMLDEGREIRVSRLRGGHHAPAWGSGATHAIINANLA
ncbi:hypothetical protein FMEAI12_3410032 [Parafrankia sp. Ea1.12]|nr:hypothetical protein FMEAI12_3410032 [Parafrankia sp. Ea1.12]